MNVATLQSLIRLACTGTPHEPGSIDMQLDGARFMTDADRAAAGRVYAAVIGSRLLPPDVGQRGRYADPVARTAGAIHTTRAQKLPQNRSQSHRDAAARRTLEAMRDERRAG